MRFLCVYLNMNCIIRQEEKRKNDGPTFMACAQEIKVRVIVTVIKQRKNNNVHSTTAKLILFMCKIQTLI